MLNIKTKEQFARLTDGLTESSYIAAFEALQHASKLAIDLGAHHGNHAESEGAVGRLLILAFRAGAAIDIDEDARKRVFDEELREASMETQRRVATITGHAPLAA